MAQRLGLVRDLNDNLHLLKRHQPYFESDHVLNIAYNLLAGGSRLEHLEVRRNDEVYLDALGAERIPDPTTAGDFCRRFTEPDVVRLMDTVNETRLRAWKEQPADFFEEAFIDADGTLAPSGGVCKQGVDIAYDGTWGYHPLVVSLANTAEPLYLVNRSGNRPSHEQADIYLQQATSSGTPTFDLLEKTSLLRHFQGRYNDEVAAYSAMLQQNPSNYNFLNNMAWTISEEMNRPEVGIKWADDALRRAGIQPRILDTRGVILTRLNRLDEAINDLEAAFQGMPSASVAFHLARAYKLKGRTQEYIKARDRARQAGLIRSQLQRSEQAEFDGIMGP